MIRTFIAALVAAAAFSACTGTPQQLPVGVSVCNAVQTPQGFHVVANVENKSNKPISGLAMATEFYQNFRYQRFVGNAQLKQELDPGQRRDVTFDVSTPAASVRGQAMRCFVTQVRYLDGTVQNAPKMQ
jgi:hypothetical protein